VVKGVDPGWKIDVSKPRIFDRVPTSQEPIRQPDWSLPPGRELWIEHAEDGFRVSVTRLVKLDDEVVEVGPGTAVRVAAEVVRSVWNDESDDAHLVIISRRDDPPDEAQIVPDFWPE
jgi:hypothetical protein